MATLLCTQLGWEANKLLPDVFAGVATLLILLYLETTSKKKWIYLGAIILIGSFHNTHFVLYILLASVLLITSIWSKHYSRSKLLAIYGASVLSLLLVAFSNYVDHNKLELGRSSEVFMIGQAAESGLLQDVLCQECPQKDWKLCVYQDSLPVRGFMYVWNGDSPAIKIGGWDAAKDEHKEILRTLYLSPRYWPKLLTSSIIRGFSNSFQLESGDGIFRYEYESNIQQSIRKYYPIDKGSAGWNKQFVLTIPFQSFTVWYLLVLGILVIVTLWFYTKGQLSHLFQSRILFVLVALFLNSWAVAQFANISDRLNTRIFWVLPFMIILVIAEKVYKKRSKTGQNNTL
jgi:hypothetical protein